MIEIETEDNDDLNTIDKLIQRINKLDIPIYTGNYFVKKAEIELDKVLGRININDKKRKRWYSCY